MQSADNIIRAFSANHVERLTGLSKNQLTYWDKTGFFSPQYAYENRTSPYSRIYSFRDVVGLKTIALLRKQYGVSLQHLRQVASELSHTNDDLWSSLTLYVMNKEVYFKEPETGKVRGVLNRQYVAIPLERIIGDLNEASKNLGQRESSQYGKIERNRFVVHNAWVLAGTRIPVNTIKRYHDAGYSIDAIIKEYPILTKVDIEAALQYEENSAKSA